MPSHRTRGGSVLDKFFREFLPGYAVTSYGSQGKTADYVLFSNSTVKAATNGQQWQHEQQWLFFDSVVKRQQVNASDFQLGFQNPLEKDMSIATALPCRIAVYEEDHRVKIATLLPTETLSLFSVPNLAPVAQEVEREIKAMIDDATGA